jgi:DNA helicase-2/ATP-dependent DNA helicase PcrA
MCNRLSAFKDDLVIPAEAAAYVEAKIANANNAGMPVDPHHLRAAAQVYVEYQRVLRDANAADFGDLLLWPVRAMHGNKEYHARWTGRFDAVLADEYQDVNRAQYSWVRLLASEHREIFAVGDDDQSIYGWRGAQIGYIRRFTRDFPGAAQVRLEENFRSTGHILAAANAVIAGSARRSTAANPTATASRWWLSATRRRKPSGSSPRSSAATARADAGRTWPSSTAATRCRAALKRR